MAELSKKAIPPVSRAFALTLQKVFRPYEVTPGFDRDELMQSVGEQRVINWILRQSNNSVLQSTLDIDSNTIDNTKVEIHRKPTLWELFTNRAYRSV